MARRYGPPVVFASRAFWYLSFLIMHLGIGDYHLLHEGVPSPCMPTPPPGQPFPPTPGGTVAT